jgi:hypothetical protein
VYTGGDKHLRVDLYSRFAQGKGVLQLSLAFVAWLLSYSPLLRVFELSVSNFVELIFVQMVAGVFVVEPSVPAVVAAFAVVAFAVVAFAVVLFELAAVVVFVVVLSGLAAVVVFVVQVVCFLYAVPAQQLL